jgi:sugar lactone lactonase YvrE
VPSPLAAAFTALLVAQGAVITSPVGTGKPGYSGDGGPAAKADLNQPFELVHDAAGNLIFSDTGNHAIRRVDRATGNITTIAGTGRKGFAGDGGPATAAQLDEPYGLTLAADGTVYFADRLNARVRRVDGRTGIISTLAGTGEKASTGDGGPAAKAALVEPNGVALDRAGRTLFIADVAGHRLRAVDLASGTIRTVAGDGTGKHVGDGGPASAAKLSGPRAVKVAADGTVLVLERNGNTLRAIRPTDGVIQTLAGTGKKGYSGDGGPAIAATFDGPKEMALDGAGNVYIVDTENQAIRRIDARTGTILTVAGNGKRGGAGDGGPATNAELDRPHGVAVAPDGAVLIGDTNNHRIRRVAP